MTTPQRQENNTIYVSAVIGGHHIIREFPAEMLRDVPTVIAADLWHLQRVARREAQSTSPRQAPAPTAEGTE